MHEEADWHALHGALIGCLALLRRKRNIGMIINSDARAVGQSYLQNLQVQSLGQHDRKLCFELLECLLDCYSDAVAPLGDDLVYGICEAIDAEKDPRCLILTFHLVEILARMFPDPSGPVASFSGELFDILGCYFPIHFTHPKNGDDDDIKRDDLSRALMLAFSSTPLFEPFAIPLLLEKLSSSLPLAKVDSLKYLSNCTLKYGADRMAKHAKSIWSSLKDSIYTSIPEELVLSLPPDSPDGRGLQENETAKEALICLQKVILQNDVIFFSLIVEDEDIELILSSVPSLRSYNDIPVESKQKLCATGYILSVAAKVSSASCNRVFGSFFPRLMDILGLSVRSSSGGCIGDDKCMLSERLNFGALYLCIELLAACRDLTMSFEEVTPQSISSEDTWVFLLQNFSSPLIGALSSFLVASINEDAYEPDIYSGVKGLQIMATFPGCFLQISKSISENILTTFMSIITMGYEKTLLWKMALKAIVQIGTFIEKSHEYDRVTSYMSVVVEKTVSLISLEDSAMPFPLKLEAISVIGTCGSKFMLRVIQGLEEAISAHFLDAAVKGNLQSTEILIQLLGCYSNKVLPWAVLFSALPNLVVSIAPPDKGNVESDIAPEMAGRSWNGLKGSNGWSIYRVGGELWNSLEQPNPRAIERHEQRTVIIVLFHKTGDFEQFTLRFAVKIWNLMENSTTFSIGVQGKELLDATMTAMKLAVRGCSEENQGLIIQKAYSVLSSSDTFPLKESLPVRTPVKLDELQLTQDVDSFSCRDDWLISLFASVIIAVLPQTHLPNVRVILKLFVTVLLRGHVPAAQALGSMVNKLPVKINGAEVSSGCTLEEATDILFMMCCSVFDTGTLRKGRCMDGSNEVDLINMSLKFSNNRLVQIHAMVGLAWIGKGLLMRGHEKVKDITMIFLRCLRSSSDMGIFPLQQGLLGDGSGKDIYPLVMKSAADAFHVLLSDSEFCLNKRFHATVRPLYKQHFFSTMMPILLSSITESDSSISRSMLYRAFGHVISDSPLIAVVTEARKIIPILLDGLSMLSVDIMDKDLTYSLLLVLSGILMDENACSRDNYSMSCCHVRAAPRKDLSHEKTVLGSDFIALAGLVSCQIMYCERYQRLLMIQRGMFAKKLLDVVKHGHQLHQEVFISEWKSNLSYFCLEYQVFQCWPDKPSLFSGRFFTIFLQPSAPNQDLKGTALGCKYVWTGERELKSHFICMVPSAKESGT
ncbi:hypothetical protein HHK36_021691 [Tetracentron sinense]|uniref:MMS19 nucleotide excision repair protein n=1 Tax=Tetracentron sinense TaxID=13715 RepID=A0A834YS25_TETSI|nr:hypothetical protein HHK36_021691 [Tetracentron sinense]